MSHIQTQPDIFIPYETYIPVAWDYSDLEQKCRHYLENEDIRSAIVENAKTRLSEFYEDHKFLNVVNDMMTKLDTSTK